MEKSGFFKSINGDRKYKADFFAEYFSSFIGNGVFPSPSTNLQVMSNNDMTVTIKQGKAWINGYYYCNTDNLILPIDVADGVLDRVDRVVLKFDTIKREIKALIKKGDFASNAVAKELQRDVDAYEIALADIQVSKGAVSITQANITDLRLNKNLCGIVHGVVDQVDTTTIFNQYLDWFKQTKGKAEIDITDMKKQFQADFIIWFDSIKNILDGDTAGNLLNLINKNLEDISEVKKQIKTNNYNLEILKQETEEGLKSTNNLITKVEKELDNYNSYSSAKDDNGIFTVVEYKRADDTLYMKSTLSNPDTEGNYANMAWEFYDEVGTTVIKTVTWEIAYDEDGDIVSKVVSV